MKPLLAAFLVISAAACVPGVSDYYKPSASGGEAVNDHCGAFIAPQSTLQFKPQGIDVRVESFGKFLLWQVRVPEGITVLLKEQKITVANSLAEYLVALENFRFTNIEEKKSQSISATEPLTGKNETFLFGNVEPRIYSTSAEFLNEMGESFSVLLPNITINGEVHEFPVIQFNKGKGFGIYPVNC